jgi:CRISPR-associated protein Csd2
MSKISAHCNPNYRHDFVLLFDCKNGNPNGDPDAGNMPRVDAETGHGLVTDVCLKRKIRNYVAMMGEESDRAEELKIFVEHHGVLNAQIRRAYKALNISVGKPVDEPVKDKKLSDMLQDIDLPEGFTFKSSDDEDATDAIPILSYSGELSDTELKTALDSIEDLDKAVRKFLEGVAKKSGKPDKNRDNVNKARDWMCQNFFDVRMFGAVMGTGLNAGQVRGPLQLTFSESLDPITPQDLSITRVAVTREEDREKMQTMGRKTFIPYGLYRGSGFFSPHLAAQTFVTQADLELFWEALVKMWEVDRSASRGMMAPHELCVFSHESKLGNAPAHKLFERIQTKLKQEDMPPRHFTDYEVTVNEADLPKGVTLTRLILG